MKKWLILILLFNLLIELHSQDIYCFGKIIDLSSNGLEFVIIVNKTTKTHISSKSDGSYKFSCRINDSICFKLFGYQDYKVLGKEIIGDHIIRLTVESYNLNEITVNRTNSKIIGYEKFKSRRTYQNLVFRTGSIMQCFYVNEDSFLLKKFKFFINDYNNTIDLNVRVVVGEDKSFKNESSYSITKPINSKNSWIEFDFSEFSHIFQEHKIYIRLDFLDNGSEICNDSSMIQLTYSRKKMKNIITYQNNLKLKFGETCWIVDSMPKWETDLFSNILIVY